MGLLGDIIDIVFDSDNDSYQEFNTQQCTCPKCGCLNATILLNDYGFKFCCPECELVLDSDSLFDKIESLLDSNNVDEVVLIHDFLFGNQYLKNKNIEYFYGILIGEALINKKSDYEKAFRYLEKSLSLYESEYPFLWLCQYCMYRVYLHNKDFSKARKFILNAYQNADGEDKIQIGDKTVNAEAYLLEEFDSIDDKYTEKYLSLPYRDRKALFITKNFSDLSQEHFTTLSIESNISQILFPVGHPHVNEMYIAHPLTTNKYYPIENYQLELVEERVREFCRMAQSLGATEINIECLNSNTTDSSNSGSIHISGDVSYEGNQIGGGHRSEYNRRMMEEISRSINLHQVFQPTKAPTLPQNLVWYNYEPSWQSLYTQRMDGGLLFEERIETKKSQVVDNREMKEIKGELETLFANMDVAFDKTEEAKFEQQENAVLAISVKFAPLSQLTGETSSQQTAMYTANEQKYIDEVKECLADGEITKTGRRLLNMQRERLGISESRAAELEASVSTPQLTDEEKEYLEAYREACEDGQISDKEHRMLNRLRDMLGITEERAIEIERIKM